MGGKEAKQPFFKLKALLVTRGIKQREVAGFLGISDASFSMKINRKGVDFSLTEIQGICDFLKISADEFFLVSGSQEWDINNIA
ncbi:helix-turn-helix domain-containing protein [Domibacillus aminovorans]|uniref:HTH cro/C1-type domain-containing protein n=1 Tax=Domibacillus aminovorans TaxID=29332 RepID=A0A177L4V0_9BACI|nr:helix-turn-helix transcriptional regulator [Domibacillus aminovorans]OAH60375.1 hypothetical protein AWH49_16740 [Domibacillus aminovorans]